MLLITTNKLICYIEFISEAEPGRYAITTKRA